MQAPVHRANSIHTVGTISLLANASCVQRSHIQSLINSSASIRIFSHESTFRTPILRTAFTHVITKLLPGQHSHLKHQFTTFRSTAYLISIHDFPYLFTNLYLCMYNILTYNHQVIVLVGPMHFINHPWNGYYLHSRSPTHYSDSLDTYSY